jgi:hypothetical protein
MANCETNRIATVVFFQFKDCSHSQYAFENETFASFFRESFLDVYFLPCVTQVIFVLVATWLIGPAYNGSYQIPTSEITAECNYTCTIYTAWPSQLAQQLVGVLTFLLKYVLPLAVLIYFYVRMTAALRTSDMSSSSEGASNVSINTTQSSVVGNCHV